MKNFVLIMSAYILIFPTILLAQFDGIDPARLKVTTGDVENSTGLFPKIVNLLDQIASVILALAILFFLVNILIYLFSGPKSEKKSESAKYMLWGIIVIFVMVGLSGFLNLLFETTGFRGGFFLPDLKS